MRPEPTLLAAAHLTRVTCKYWRTRARSSHISVWGHRLEAEIDSVQLSQGNLVSLSQFNGADRIADNFRCFDLVGFQRADCVNVNQGQSDVIGDYSCALWASPMNRDSLDCRCAVASH